LLVTPGAQQDIQNLVDALVASAIPLGSVLQVRATAATYTDTVMPITGYHDSEQQLYVFNLSLLNNWCHTQAQMFLARKKTRHTIM
jgi:hypothetical protein